MICPKCAAPTGVFDSRAQDAGRIVYRRRRCDGCGHRFTTFESPEEAIAAEAPHVGLSVGLAAASPHLGTRERQRHIVGAAAQLVDLLNLMTAEDVETLLRVAERFADATEANASARERAA